VERRAGVSDGEAASLDNGPVDDGDTAEDDAAVRTPRDQDRPVPRSAAPAAPSVPWVARSRGRAVFAAAIAALGVAAVYVLASAGPVRTVLRQSFSQMSSPSIQFYFNGDPWVSGELLNVPLGILLNASYAGSYTVRLWTVDGAGKSDFSSTVTVPVRNGAGTANVSLPVPVGGQVLWAQLEGTSLAVHFRFAGSALAPASGSS